MLKDWLQLIYLKGLTLDAKRQLVTELGSPRSVLETSPTTIAALIDNGRCKGRPTTPDARDDLDSDLAVLARTGAEFVEFTHPDYPWLLNQVHSAPLGLFTLGDRTLLKHPQLAVVGSRRPTPSGKRTTELFAAELCGYDLAITSGMAIGIDSHAHRGCLDAGGKTIAVMATGIDLVYPRQNRALSQEISRSGLIVTEYPPGTPPRRAHFPRRNRIISGLSVGTLVVEAGLRSGSLITARLAAEQGREVFAIPGSIHVPTSRGCHYLLKQGAKLVENISDILSELGHFLGPTPTVPADKRPLPLLGMLAEIYSLIDYAPIAIDQLIEQSGLTADQVSSILMDLELKGLVVATTGGYQRLPE